jgi:hypothetical protein
MSTLKDIVEAYIEYRQNAEDNKETIIDKYFTNEIEKEQVKILVKGGQNGKHSN